MPAILAAIVALMLVIRAYRERDPICAGFAAIVICIAAAMAVSGAQAAD